MVDQLQERLADALAGHYEMVGELGRGGMGVVYRATDTRLHRDVAIKVLPPDLSFRAELRERFVRESQLAGSLSHPNIVPIHDVGEGAGLVWYVMSYVDGQSVRHKVERDGPFTPAQTRRVIREVAWALGYAHARGIIHRDVKPDNILIEHGTGRALVTDFGIAKMAEEDSDTAPGLILGSLMYMAPEQATGEGDIDARSDLYSLGLCGYFMLAGRPPFDRATIVTVAARMATGVMPVRPALGSGEDRELLTLLDRCVQPAPDARPENAEQVLEGLGPLGLEPRPMPASIRRLVRDFMIFPTLGFMILVIKIVTENPLPVEFVSWLALVLSMNFGISLRAFTRGGFQWPDLRDALEMEVARQSEEFEETAQVKQRFSAFIHLVTFMAIAVAGLQAVVQLGLEPIIPIALGTVLLAAPVSYPVAWLQIKILSFFGRVATRILPSMPRPEGETWSARTADRLLAKLFRPVRLRAPEVQPTTTSGWRESEVGSARRSARTIDAICGTLPDGFEDQVVIARRTARQLTAAIREGRLERSEVERARAREIEALGALSRDAAAGMEQLRLALSELADGTGSRAAVDRAIELGRIISTRFGSEPSGMARRSGPSKRGWLGMQLGAAIEGSAVSDAAEVDDLGTMATAVSRMWEGIDSLQRRVPGGDEAVRELVKKVRELQGTTALRRQRGMAPDESLEQSVTRCESVLRALQTAMARFEADQADTAEVEGMLLLVEQLHVQVEEVLAASS